MWITSILTIFLPICTINWVYYACDHVISPMNFSFTFLGASCWFTHGLYLSSQLPHFPLLFSWLQTLGIRMIDQHMPLKSIYIPGSRFWDISPFLWAYSKISWRTLCFSLYLEVEVREWCLACLLQAGADDLMQQAQSFSYTNGNNHPPTAINLEKSLLRDLFFNQSPAKVMLFFSAIYHLVFYCHGLWSSILILSLKILNIVEIWFWLN